MTLNDVDLQPIKRMAEYKSYIFGDALFENAGRSFSSSDLWMPPRYSDAIVPEKLVTHANLLKTSYVELAGLSELLGQLAALMKSEDYNDDFLSPTESATSRVRELLTRAGASLDADFPAGTIYADGDGGLRLEWIRPERELRFVVSASPQGRSYIYHEQGDNYAVDYAPNANELSKWLHWLEN